MIWRIRDRDFDLARRGWIMGILNVTPDSFSDGGKFCAHPDAVRRGMALLDEGADLLDVGGESSRPGADPVTVEEELERVVPVVRELRKLTSALISVDTTKADVAEAALDAGADVINDISGLTADDRMPEVVARYRAGAVVMHRQGTPRTMQIAPAYADVVGEVGDFFRQTLRQAVICGIDPMSIVLDPGIGFGKLHVHNMALVRGLSGFLEFGRPILLGISRKSFLGSLAGTSKLSDRLMPGVALTCHGRMAGARIFRVHDVTPHREALRTIEAVIDHD